MFVIWFIHDICSILWCVHISKALSFSVLALLSFQHFPIAIWRIYIRILVSRFLNRLFMPILHFISWQLLQFSFTIMPRLSSLAHSLYWLIVNIQVYIWDVFFTNYHEVCFIAVNIQSIFFTGCYNIVYWCLYPASVSANTIVSLSYLIFSLSIYLYTFVWFF